MATKKKEEYVSQAKTVEITATSRVAKKWNNDFYTIEATERRTVSEGADMEKEWQLLFDSVNEVVDNQMYETIEAVRNNK